MKQKSVIRRFVLLLALIPTICQAQDVVNYLSAASSICVPVKVKTNLGTFEVYHEPKTVVGYISSIEAWDCEGTKIMDLSPDHSEKSYSTEHPTRMVYTYIFKTLYSSSASSSSRSSSGSGNWGKVAQKAATIQMDGYPNVQLQLGGSTSYGEYARVKYCGGGAGGGMVYASVGKDMLSDAEFNNKLLWNVGFGYYFTMSKNSDFSIDVNYGQTSKIKEKVMGVNIAFSYFFGKSTRFGLFGGAGYDMTTPWGDNMVTESAWDVNIGTYR